jgi:uncharacterized protein (UPF0332 family)
VKPGTDKLLARAARSLSAASRALDDGAPDIAAARAYAAMIAAAKALLNEKGLRLTAHASIRTAFDEHAPGAGLAARHTARLGEAQDRRARSVSEDLSPSFDDAREWIEQAAELVTAVERSLRA